MTYRNVIPIVSVSGTCDESERGNAVPLLHEVRHALVRLLESGEPGCIDLRAIPMGPGDEAALEAALGVGEVAVTLSALGPSTLQETAFPGVWLVTHRNEAEQIISRFIEIAFVPAILESPESDVMAGLMRLGALLDGHEPHAAAAASEGGLHAGR